MSLRSGSVAVLDPLSSAGLSTAERIASGAHATTSPASAEADAVRVGGKAWRAQLREWLALLGGLKGGKGLFRWQELQRAVALQLTDLDPGVQQAALKSLKVCRHYHATSVVAAEPTCTWFRSRAPTASCCKGASAP